jgi:hypothetical protein
MQSRSVLTRGTNKLVAVEKVSDVPAGCLMVSRLEAMKLTSDGFDLHSISLRCKIRKSDKESVQGELECANFNVTSLTAG